MNWVCIIPKKKFAKKFIRVLLATAFAFVLVNGLLRDVGTQHSWRWAVALLLALAVALAVNELATCLYSKYGPDL